MKIEKIEKEGIMWARKRMKNPNLIPYRNVFLSPLPHTFGQNIYNVNAFTLGYKQGNNILNICHNRRQSNICYNRRL